MFCMNTAILKVFDILCHVSILSYDGAYLRKIISELLIKCGVFFHMNKN
jgi:hypothetical protein